MTQLVLISFIILQVTISTVITVSEPIGDDCELRKAQKTDCATKCDIDSCPVDKNYSRKCNREGCEPGCKCLFNQKFASNGTCIDTEHCPPFDCDLPNEEYVACPSYCGDGCLEGCPVGGMFIVLECFPACRCKKGFSRKADVCVVNAMC